MKLHGEAHGMMAVNVKELCENLILSGHNVVVTGQAGTGKTCLMKEMAEVQRSWEDRCNSLHHRDCHTQLC